MTLNESHVKEVALEWFLLRHRLRQGYDGQEGYGGQVGELRDAIGHEMIQS